MVKIYVRMILAGRMAIEDVPELWREDVRAALAENGEAGE